MPVHRFPGLDPASAPRWRLHAPPFLLADFPKISKMQRFCVAGFCSSSHTPNRHSACPSAWIDEDRMAKGGCYETAMVGSNCLAPRDLCRRARDCGSRWRRTALHRPAVVHRTVGPLNVNRRVVVALFG